MMTDAPETSAISGYRSASTSRARRTRSPRPATVAGIFRGRSSAAKRSTSPFPSALSQPPTRRSPTSDHSSHSGTGRPHPQSSLLPMPRANRYLASPMAHVPGVVARRRSRTVDPDRPSPPMYRTFVRSGLTVTRRSHGVPEAPGLGRDDREHVADLLFHPAPLVRAGLRPRVHDRELLLVPVERRWIEVGEAGHLVEDRPRIRGHLLVADHEGPLVVLGQITVAVLVVEAPLVGTDLHDGRTVELLPTGRQPEAPRLTGVPLDGEVGRQLEPLESRLLGPTLVDRCD